jgi:hypothetical protein
VAHGGAGNRDRPRCGACRALRRRQWGRRGSEHRKSRQDRRCREYPAGGHDAIGAKLLCRDQCQLFAPLVGACKTHNNLQGLGALQLDVDAQSSCRPAVKSWIF